MSAHKIALDTFPRYARVCGYCERVNEESTCSGCGAPIKTGRRKHERLSLFYYDLVQPEVARELNITMTQTELREYYGV